MKNILLVTGIFTLFLLSCPQPSGPSKGNTNTNNDNKNKTAIVFNNTQGLCAVSVYSDHQRKETDKIATVPAGNSSQKIEWRPSDSYPFYFSYTITLNGVNNFSINFIPARGKDQKLVRIDANITNNIVIPKLDETLSNPDALLSRDSYISIQNVSSFSFKLQRGAVLIPPDKAASAVVNAGERALYTINPDAASLYKLLVGADYRDFTGTVDRFEAGHFYEFYFDGNAISLFSKIPVTVANMPPPTIKQSTPPPSPHV